MAVALPQRPKRVMGYLLRKPLPIIYKPPLDNRRNYGYNEIVTNYRTMIQQLE